jgi:hypothetical protein
MGALVIGSAYAALRETPPPLREETPVLPAIEAWQPAATLSQAQVINVLQGPAMAVREKAASSVAIETEKDVPSSSLEGPSSESRSSASRSYESRSSESPSFVAPPPESREVIIDDSKMYPPTTAPTPYPDPTTTPPDAVAPPGAGPSTSTPQLDSENPYQQ